MIPNDRPPHDPELREQVTRLRQFMRRAARFWPTLVGTLVLGGIGFCVFSFVRQPHYRSETVILYVERRGPDETAGGEAAKQAVTVRLKELLFSRPNLERVVNKFGLYPDVRRRYGMVDAVEELKKHIDFKAPGGDTFSIAFEGTSPSQAQQVTQELSRLVIDGDSELRKGQARSALDFLTGERKLRDADLRAAEEQLAAFMAKHPRFALDATPLANGAAIRATMSETPAAPTPGAPAVRWPPPIRATAPGAPKPAVPGVTPSVAAAPAANAAEEGRARAALAAANENLTEKLARYTPAHPDVRAAEAAVQRANERLAALAAATPAPAPAPAAPAAEAPAAEAPSPAPAPRPAAAGPGPARIAPAPALPSRADANQNLVELETEWLRLTRAVTEARQRQDQIEGQLFRADIQVSSATGGHGAQVNVIDPAFLPQRPEPPGRATIAVLFLVGSLLIGALATLLRAFIDERVFVAAEVAEVSEVLVEIPRVMKRRAHAAT